MKKLAVFNSDKLIQSVVIVLFDYSVTYHFLQMKNPYRPLKVR